MSIDLLNNLAAGLINKISPEEKAHTHHIAEKNFKQVLEELATGSELQEKTPHRLASIAQLSQIQMLHSLFVEEDDADNSLFSTAQSAGDFGLLQTQRSQYIDKYYAAQRPSLVTDQPLGRHDIDKLIEQVAVKVSLAPALIRSVVATESAYRADAVSPVGAQGLMQLMPETARELGVSDSFNAHENLLGGSRYLKQLLDKYDGDLDHALAAYNWGQGNVDRQGLAKMPTETRNYLTRIKSLLNHEAV